MIQPDEVAGTLEELRRYFSVLEEVQLCDFGESANSGPWVKFRLAAPESLEPYRGQDRSGRNARTGKRYTLMLIEINDQEEHMQAENQAIPKAYKLSQIAGAKCNDPNFRAWLKAEFDEPFPDAEAAAVFIRQTCGIGSRSQLDTSEHAASVFRTLLEDYNKACGNAG